MRKGNQVKIVGKHPYASRDQIIHYDWPRVYRHITSEERDAWYDSPHSKGINSAGETKLPPTCVQVKFEGGTEHRPSEATNTVIGWEDRTRLSDDTFTVVRARCAPILMYSKMSGMTLIRNNRTGEEGYIRRAMLEVVK